MFKQVVIVEKSKIIREGLTALFQKHEISKRLVDLEEFGEWVSALKGAAPDLIILGQDVIREGLDKIRTKYQIPDGALFVGIIYQYYNIKEVTEIFDELIFITDSEDTLVNKLKGLFKQIGNETPVVSEKLTDREKDVLRLLLQGQSNKEVADNLSISPHTVVTHRKNIIEKTGIRSLSGLAVYAILNNIADMEDLKQ